MRISTLINDLERLREEVGDAEVVIFGKFGGFQHGDPVRMVAKGEVQDQFLAVLHTTQPTRLFPDQENQP